MSVGRILDKASRIVVAPNVSGATGATGASGATGATGPVGATGSSGGSLPLVTATNTDNIDGSGVGYVGLGTTNMGGPATFTSSTGRVRVTVQVTVLPGTSGDNVQAQLMLDGTTTFGVFAQETASGAEAQAAFFTLISYYTTDLAPHSWGVQLNASNPGGSDTWQINAGGGGQILVMVEDVAP